LGWIYLYKVTLITFPMVALFVFGGMTDIIGSEGGGGLCLVLCCCYTPLIIFFTMIAEIGCCGFVGLYFCVFLSTCIMHGSGVRECGT